MPKAAFARALFVGEFNAVHAQAACADVIAASVIFAFNRVASCIWASPMSAFSIAVQVTQNVTDMADATRAVRRTSAFGGLAGGVCAVPEATFARALLVGEFNAVHAQAARSEVVAASVIFAFNRVTSCIWSKPVSAFSRAA